MSRVLIAANRLPVTATLGPDGIAFAPSSGGLATALGRIHQSRGGLWIGSPGIASDQLDGAGWDDLVETLGRDRLIPIAISGEESQRFYDGFSNSFIWPILHSFTGRQPADTDDWETYRAIN
ncbi:MAG: trehalose-6-phosphate synthase, partial [Gemmatimonadetes bacterium]|nr:trehalose-6-phosphate synthase [Gemmatimonadota bacterium]